MSTHALITTTKTKDLKNYKGVYVHYDGYPEGLGDFLITAYKEEGWTFIKEVLLKNEWGSLTLNESNEIDYHKGFTDTGIFVNSVLESGETFNTACNLLDNFQTSNVYKEVA